MSDDDTDNDFQSQERPEPTPMVLVVDDDAAMRKATRAVVQRENYEVQGAANAEDALAILAERPPNVMLLDIQMPGMSGLELLKIVKRDFPLVEVIMMTAFGTVEKAVQAVKDGAFDFLTKPFESIDHVSNVVDKAVNHGRLKARNQFLEQALEIRDRYEDMVGKSARMREVFELVDSVSYSASNILIQGESGTGKELVARAIHFRSPRNKRPFIVINCSALAESLLESELFGHVKGSFTGAINHKRGLFEAAHTGTIFLDEIGDIAAATQVKLLRVLQEGEIKRVGSDEVINVDVRTIAATNRNLQEAMRDGSFREDLFYRLNVINVTLPPLRERVEDIPLIAYHMLKRYNATMGKQVTAFESDVLEVLHNYRWPGNVRELENVVERAVVLVRGETVEIRHLPDHLRGDNYTRNADEVTFSNLEFTTAKKLAVHAFEKRYLTQLLSRTDGNISQASRQAGLDRSNFRRILRKHDIDVDQLAT
jgi:DNA-binding NtrC family response regulator